MNWEDERYVRLYTRDTVTWKLWDWRARTTFMHMCRKADRAGVLDVGESGVAGLAALVDLPFDIVDSGVAQLEASGTVEHAASSFVIVRFIEAQEAKSTNAQRQRAWREKRRDVARVSVTPSNAVSQNSSLALQNSSPRYEDPSSTSNELDGNGDHKCVTPRYEMSQGVTKCRQTSRPLAEVVTPSLADSVFANGRHLSRPQGEVVTSDSLDLSDPFEAADPPPPRAPRRRRATPTPTPNPLDLAAADALKHYASSYRAAYGAGASNPTKQVIARVRQLVEHHELEEFCRRVTRAHQDPPSWPPPPWDFAMITQHFDRLVDAPAVSAPRQRSVNGLAVGRYEPPNGKTDYSATFGEVNFDDIQKHRS